MAKNAIEAPSYLGRWVATRLHHSSAWHDVACMHRFELSHDLTDRPRVGAPSSCQLVFARGPRPFAWYHGSKVRALEQKPSPADHVLLEATLGSEPGTSPMCPEIVLERPNLCLHHHPPSETAAAWGSPGRRRPCQWWGQAPKSWNWPRTTGSCREALARYDAPQRHDHASCAILPLAQGQ